MRLFADPAPGRYGFEWDHDRWEVGMRVLTLGDRKDIARIERVNPPAEWAQLELRSTLERALLDVNGQVPDGERTWAEELERAPETFVELAAGAYREVRLATVTPPEDAAALEAAHATLQTYLEGRPGLLAEEPGDAIFAVIAPIPRYVWWAGRFYLVHFKILTLGERRLIARFLGVAPTDQGPHLELQHTLARAVVAVNQVAVADEVGAGLDARMAWVEEFPESLAALLAGEYEKARQEPRGVLYGLLADPKG